MGPSCSSPRTASSMVSPRRAIRPIVPIYPVIVNHRRSPRAIWGMRTLLRSPPPSALVRPARRTLPRAPGEPKLSGKRRAASPADKTSPKPPTSKKAKLKRVALWLLVAGLVGALLMAGAFFYAYKTIDIPDPNKDFQTQTSFVYYADGKTELGTYAIQNRERIPLKEIPQKMQDAVVAAENKTFWTDKGIDPKGILRAAFSNAKGNATQGASTITQQYVKILYLSQERTFSRKIKEAFLECYLNTIYFGRGAYGVQAASNAYFDKPAKKLTVPQSAMLAAVLNSPTYLSSSSGREAFLAR